MTVTTTGRSGEAEDHDTRHDACGEGAGRNPGGNPAGASNPPSEGNSLIDETKQLIEQMIERGNLNAAWRRVRSNKGAPGVDGRGFAETETLIREHWPEIREHLLAGTYMPKAVKRVEIPKPGGGKRKLGVPTILDRWVQQAALQVLIAIFEPGFSPHSYGFRPGRSAHEAVRQAQQYQEEGKRIVVDIDLESFFDEVNHDLLMGRVRRRVKDKRMLKLIRAFLQSGVMEGGLTQTTDKGTPQGGPLSPLLSNILLDDLDKELEKRGHSFCRYADDCNIYVATQRSGERVMESLTRFIETKLKLKVNRAKSAVDWPTNRSFLGLSFTIQKKPKIRVPKKSVKKLKGKLKELFREGRGRNLFFFIKERLNPVLRGWINYFRLAETKGFAEELDSWIRRRLRGILWRQWKRPYTRFRRLMSAGLSEEHARMGAWNGRGPWFNAGASHMNAAFPKAYFDEMGLISLLDSLRRRATTSTSGTAVIREPFVRWCESRGG
jgi:RNA-directed DNA polymerase